MTGLTALNVSFSSLGMDSQFVRQAERLGLYNLGDIMAINLEELKQKNEFTYSWYADMLNLLKRHNLLSHFQEKNLF